MTSTYHYTNKDFIFKTDWEINEKSKLDDLLIENWNFLHEHGSCFKFKLKIEQSKILPGRLRFLAQLNKDRALLRRKPAEMQSMKQKFDDSSFNFTKMNEEEILFQVVNKERNNAGNFVAINVSPLEFGHCLLLPSLHSCLPQVVTADSLLAATELFLLSKSPSLRMGFNGLCAYASLNHLHYHLYYLQQPMLLETIEVEHLAGPCYMLTAFPSRGFVFQLSQEQDVMQFVSNVFKLVNYLQENEKPHNIFITRGTSFEETSPSSVRDHVRFYVWARKPVYGAKNSSADDQLERMSPALCELFGHLLIKTDEDYNKITEEFATKMLSDITLEPFNSLVEKVKLLFQDL